MTELVVDRARGGCVGSPVVVCIAAESNAYARGVLASLEHRTMVVPAIWALEMTNVLSLSLRQNRLQQRELDGALKLLGKLTIVEIGMPWSKCLVDLIPIATAMRLTVYDAAYLELALWLQVPLAT